jgi:hypothetical protein
MLARSTGESSASIRTRVFTNAGVRARTCAATVYLVPTPRRCSATPRLAGISRHERSIASRASRGRIADLAGSATIGAEHIAEAITYRSNAGTRSVSRGVLGHLHRRTLQRYRHHGWTSGWRQVKNMLADSKGNKSYGKKVRRCDAADLIIPSRLERSFLPLVVRSCNLHMGTAHGPIAVHAIGGAAIPAVGDFRENLVAGPR